MKTKKYSQLMVIVMLIMMIKPAYFVPVDGDFNSPSEGKKSDAQMYFDQIPEEKRNSFIKHYLAEGLRKTSKTAYLDMIEEENFEEFGTPPPNFTTDFLEWTKEQFDLEDSEIEVIALGSKRVCLPGKGCYPDDIGPQCCPF